MTRSPAEAPDPAAPTPAHAAGSRRARLAWRVGTPAMVLISGGLFAVSSTTSDGTDLRPGRYTDLASLVQSEADDYQALQGEVAALNADISALTADIQDVEVRRMQEQADLLRDPAGLVPRSGSGVTVVLSDAPEDVLEEARENDDIGLNRLVVHQQDIQAVVNAMWSGGAAAVTIQGQRVVTTTGIKCTGSAVQLQGVPYPEPYTIQAVGDPALIEAALASDIDVSAFRADAEEPDISVGWEFSEEEDVEAPAYAGLVDITYAKPLR